MKKIEILSPAGTMESFYAALLGGCDAVYLAGYQFGARSYAGNFSMEELKEAIEIAHLYQVKVYVTVNTMIYESEVDTFLNYIDHLVTLHPDALIIEDIGMFDLIHQRYVCEKDRNEKSCDCKGNTYRRNKKDKGTCRFTNRSILPWSTLYQLFWTVFDV